MLAPRSSSGGWPTRAAGNKSMLLLLCVLITTIYLWVIHDDGTAGATSVGSPTSGLGLHSTPALRLQPGRFSFDDAPASGAPPAAAPIAPSTGGSVADPSPSPSPDSSPSASAPDAVAVAGSTAQDAVAESTASSHAADGAALSSSAQSQ